MKRLILFILFCLMFISLKSHAQTAQTLCQQYYLNQIVLSESVYDSISQSCIINSMPEDAYTEIMLFIQDEEGDGPYTGSMDDAAAQWDQADAECQADAGCEFDDQVGNLYNQFLNC